MNRIFAKWHKHMYMTPVPDTYEIDDLEDAFLAGVDASAEIARDYQMNVDITEKYGEGLCDGAMAAEIRIRAQLIDFTGSA